MNPQRRVAKEMMKSRNPKTRNVGRKLSRGRVKPGSMLETVLALSEGIMKDGSGGAGPATGAPMTGADAYTPTYSEREQPTKKRKSRLKVPFLHQ